MEVKFFRQASGFSPVEDFIINNLQPQDQKRANKAIKRVYEQQFGLSKLFEAEYAKTIEKDIFELRPNRLRILFTLREKVCWLLHIFFKKSNKIPLKELNIARQRKNIILNN